jgi:aminoglycoside phosphotransferase (APT) family kinase protein
MPAVPIDEHELQQRAEIVMAEAQPGSELGPITQLQGGLSSITYWARFTSPAEISKVVVKAAPAGLAPTKNRDVLRQARLQRALQGSGVPCPAVLAEHPGAPPDIPPFFVMTFEEGECVEPNLLPPELRLPAEEVTERELAAARILGTLHSLDPDSIGLGEEPVIDPAHELERWSQAFAACDEDLRVGSDAVRQSLEASIPGAERSTVIHGDFRVGNTLSKGTEVISVIDWEIWARADPRVDLAWFLLMSNPDPELGRPTSDGMPSNDELIDTYQRSRGAKIVDMVWFQGLVRYKQAATTALIIRNARRRGEDPPSSGPSVLLGSAKAMLQ